MLLRLLSVLLVFGTISSASAFSNDNGDYTQIGGRRDRGSWQDEDEVNKGDNFEITRRPNPGSGNGLDSQIVAAVEARRRTNFVEGGGMVVTELLPDDNNGLKHQKWMVRLSNGAQMQAVYNSDMCPRVPIKVGDIVSMGGQFIYSNEGPMLHWLHYDPRRERPDGYVEINGTSYCRDGERK
ncbi:MAG: DUF3465 domain-containing protein [Proteobacteria bacterium]|nr:MAG: DUF3465 domain-containing protein [Pseudomonadota bacterium]